MQIKKTKILTSALAILLTTTAFTSANGAPALRSPYQSCISLTTHFDQLKKQNHQFSARDQLTFQTTNLPNSQKYFTSYQDKNKTLFLFQSPLNPQKQSLNIANTKALAKLKLPAKRNNIQHFIIQDKRLFITAEQGSQSTILIYSIGESRIKPFQTYYSTGKIKHIATARENLFFLTESPLSQSAFDRLFKTQGEDLTILPKVEKSLKFWLSKTLLDQAQCKKISHHFSEQGGSFFTLLNFQTSDLQQAPKVNYFLGNLKEVVFAQDYFYFLSSDSDSVFASRFFRDPKLQFQSSQSLSGQLLQDQSSTSKKNTLELITKNANHNYQLSLWNEDKRKNLTFLQQTETQNLEYQNAHFSNTSIKLQNKKNQTFHFFPLDSAGLQSPHSIKINQKQDYLLEIESINQLQNLQKILSQKADQLQAQSRNSKENLLFLLLKTPDQKTLLEIYQISQQEPSKLLFLRDYTKLNDQLTFHNIHANQQRIAIDFGNMIDFFLFPNPKATKTFRL